MPYSVPDDVKLVYDYAAGRTWCKYCETFTLVVEWRDMIEARPLGEWSLSGVQLKVSAIETEWPWLVCTLCRRESKGKR